jgi:hypothetical protein
MAKTKKMKISVGELIGYIISGILALGGLTLAVLGIVARNLSDVNNALRQADDKLIETIKFGFQPLGAMILFLGAVLAVIILVVVGKRVDVEDERQARRAQRFSLEQDSQKTE